MNAAREANDLVTLASQGSDHLERMRELLGSSAPPDVAVVKRVIAATRALRGTASLQGLDVLQGYLGRVFQLLEDVESGEVPWSARLPGRDRAVKRRAQLPGESGAATRRCCPPWLGQWPSAPSGCGPIWPD